MQAGISEPFKRLAYSVIYSKNFAKTLEQFHNNESSVDDFWDIIITVAVNLTSQVCSYVCMCSFTEHLHLMGQIEVNW